MGLTISVQYNGQPLAYTIVMQEENVYQLRFQQENKTGSFIPEKMITRKKGMVWVSDCENYRELVAALTAEITGFDKNQQKVKPA